MSHNLIKLEECECIVIIKRNSYKITLKLSIFKISNKYSIIKLIQFIEYNLIA